MWTDIYIIYTCDVDQLVLAIYHPSGLKLVIDMVLSITAWVLLLAQISPVPPFINNSTYRILVHSFGKVAGVTVIKSLTKQINLLVHNQSPLNLSGSAGLIDRVNVMPVTKC